MFPGLFRFRDILAKGMGHALACRCRPRPGKRLAESGHGLKPAALLACGDGARIQKKGLTVSKIVHIIHSI